MIRSDNEDSIRLFKKLRFEPAGVQSGTVQAGASLLTVEVRSAAKPHRLPGNVTSIASTEAPVGSDVFPARTA